MRRIIFLVSAFFLVAPAFSFAWWDTAWSDRLIITFNNSSSTEILSNFPVSLTLNNSWFDYSKARLSGQDIRFIDTDDNTVLAYEIEEWNRNATSTLWVNIPSLATGTTDFVYMYYGNGLANTGSNPTGVWDSNFKAVYHLGQNRIDTATSTEDSTANNNDLTSTGNPTATSSIIDGSFFFDGVSDIFEAANSASLNVSTTATFSVWSNARSFKNTSAFIRGLLSKFNSGGTNAPILRYGNAVSGNQDNPVCFMRIGGVSKQIVDSTNRATSTWYYHTCSYDGSTLALYTNGILATSTSASGAITTSSDVFTIGTDYKPDLAATDREWDGYLDEARVSATARSLAWIQAEYNSVINKFASATLETYPEISNTGWLNASSTGEDYNEWTTPSNALIQDEVFSNADCGSDQDFYNFNINLPTNSVIEGFKFRIVGKRNSVACLPNSAQSGSLSASWNSGTSYSSNISAGQFEGLTSSTVITGGQDFLFNRIWLLDEVSNANFRVKVSPAYLYEQLIDVVQVKIYYTKPVSSTLMTYQKTNRIGLGFGIIIGIVFLVLAILIIFT